MNSALVYQAETLVTLIKLVHLKQFTQLSFFFKTRPPVLKSPMILRGGYPLPLVTCAVRRPERGDWEKWDPVEPIFLI